MWGYKVQEGNATTFVFAAVVIATMTTIAACHVLTPISSVIGLDNCVQPFKLRGSIAEQAVAGKNRESSGGKGTKLISTVTKNY